MTTTTRTTRKAPWAAVLTALLAVFALLGAVLVFSAPAANAGDFYICHADVNGTNGPGGPNSDDPNGQPNLGEGGTGGQSGTGLNLLPVTEQAWLNAHKDRHPSDRPAYEWEIAAGYCGAPQPVDGSAMLEGTIAICYSTDFATLTTVPWKVAATATGADKNAADAAALAKLTPEVVSAAKTTALAPFAPYRAPFADGTCTESTTTTVQASTWICLSTLTTSISVAGPVLTGADQGAARAALLASLTATYPGYVETTQGADCSNPPPPPVEPPVTPPVEELTPVAVVEAATVAPVLAATVSTSEPETVAVPAPATVQLPATVPAGDGSTVPQVPIALLALLALATAAAVTSGLRLAATR